MVTDSIAGAENVHLPGVRHLCLPMQPAVQEVLARELVNLATACGGP